MAVAMATYLNFVPSIIADCHSNLHIPLSGLGTLIKLRPIKNEVDVIAHISWEDDLWEPQARDWSGIVELWRIVLDLTSGREVR